MKALVLSGGGSKGSWMAGVLSYLLGELNLNYKILCGVSTGAINSAFLAQFPSGQEQKAAKVLKELWLNIDTKHIYKRWQPWGRWHALWKMSFYDSSPLQNLIKQNISLNKIQSSGKQIAVGAVSLSSGKYHIFNQNDDDFVDAVIASASFPGMLAPVRMRDQWWSDGGMKEHTPIRVAIELGATEIDVITTSPQTRVRHFIEYPSVIDILKRSIDLSTDKIMSNDIEKVLMYNRLVETGTIDKKFVKLNIIRPEHNLIEDLLDFDPTKIKEMIEKGYFDARNQYPANIST